MSAKPRFLFVLLSVIVISIPLWRPDSLLGDAFVSPLPTPALPTPTPVPVPECHALAVAHVARTHGIPQDRLLAGSCVSERDGRWACDGKEEWFEFPLVQQRACAVRVWTKDGDDSYTVAVDEQGRIVDLADLRARERAAGIAQCGKLDPALCARWSALADDKEIEVALWLTSPDTQAIFDAVAARYPVSLQPVPGAAFDIGHPDYRQALSEVEKLAGEAYLEKATPILSLLKTMGAQDVGAITTAPIVFAGLSKRAISILGARDDVNTIYLSEGHFENLVNSGRHHPRVAVLGRGEHREGDCFAVLAVTFAPKLKDAPSAHRNRQPATGT